MKDSALSTTWMLVEDDWAIARSAPSTGTYAHTSESQILSAASEYCWDTAVYQFSMKLRQTRGLSPLLLKGLVVANLYLIGISHHESRQHDSKLF